MSRDDHVTIHGRSVTAPDRHAPPGWAFLGLTPETLAWHARAACRDAEPDAFFPEQGSNAATAKQICAGCPVRAECLAYAVDRGERFGIWGGLSERERRPLRRHHDETVRATVARALNRPGEDDDQGDEHGAAEPDLFCRHCGHGPLATSHTQHLPLADLHRGRGLCGSCYYKARREGWLQRYPRPERTAPRAAAIAAHWAALRDRGFTQADAAAELGMSYGGFRDALRRHRRHTQRQPAHRVAGEQEAA